MPRIYTDDGTEEWVDELLANRDSARQPELTDEQREAIEVEVGQRVARAEIVAGTRKGVQDVYDAEAEHIAKVDRALGRIGKVGPLMDIADAALTDVVDAAVPGGGMVLGVALDSYVMAEAINAGVPAGEIAKMVGVIVGEFVLGLVIPVPVLDEIFPTNLVCRGILKRYGDRIKAAHKEKQKKGGAKRNSQQRGQGMD
ncbi:DUF4112 domain-containing protein [Candidatus Peregrinibacteria bacterium]|nr:DUF4112 domain-containing protein [Candidatus Peregrinibacteria bacterium]